MCANRTLIFEDSLEGFSLEIDGQNELDLTKLKELDEQVKFLESAFQRVYPSVDFKKFQFTVADSETAKPKIRIYLKAPNEYINGLGKLTREELFNLLNKLGESQLSAAQPSTDRKKNGITPNDLEQGFQLESSEKDENTGDSKKDFNEDVDTNDNSAEAKPSGEKEPSKQLELGDSGDNDGESLKKEFDIRTEVTRILEFSDESNFSRCATATTLDGRSLKFQVPNEDHLSKVELSKIFNLPCTIEYDSVATKKQTYKDFLNITFDEQINRLYVHHLRLRKLPSFEQRSDILASINQILQKSLRD